MEKMTELKAKAYDALAKLEYLQSEVEKCKKELDSLNVQIKAEFDASKSAEIVEVEEVN